MIVHYAHLCEKAFISQNGNLNIIGIFENVSAQDFPMVFPQLSIVSVLSGETGTHQQTIRIVDQKTQKEILKPIGVNINVSSKNKDQKENEKPGNLRIIGDINNLTIQEPGEYEVQIYLDGEEKYKIPFKATKSPKPIPEGR